MKHIKFLFFTCTFVLYSATLFSQKDTLTEQVKTGWSFGVLPAIAFDSDIGFKYGGILSLYHYGDGSSYPKYDHSFYFEWSRTTKGSGINEFTYDSEKLIPGIRLSTEASYLTEKALDFYGFNGSQSVYDSQIEDNLSSLYYRQERKMLRLRADFQGKLRVENLKWLAGFIHYNIKTDTVDLETLNEGRDEPFPAIDGGLYGSYILSGVIPADQIDGGTQNIIKAGLVYDTRNNEPNPTKGIWTTVQLLVAPGFLNPDYSFAKLALIHCHYFTLFPNRLSLALRASYQPKIWGTMPYYMLPFIYGTAPVKTRDGLGGAKNLRGVLRNRVVGEDYFYGNNELRWKIFRKVIFNQNIYFAITTFLDYGMVTGNYEFEDPSIVPQIVTNKSDKLHLSTGIGFYGAMNENFVLAINYGVALDDNDGSNGLYIGLNFLY